MDLERRIIPAEAAGEIGRKEFRHLVKHLAIVHEALKAMGEAAGNVELAAVFGRQFKALPLAKGRRIGAHVDQDVENFADGAADQLDFGFWLRLEVEAADGAALAGERKVALRPAGVQAQPGEFIFTEGARQKPAFIRVQIQVDQPQAGEGGRGIFHIKRWRPAGWG